MPVNMVGFGAVGVIFSVVLLIVLGAKLWWVRVIVA